MRRVSLFKVYLIKKLYKFLGVTFFMANWRESVKPPLKLHLEKAIRKSAEQKETISLANDKKAAQLWIAISQLSKDLQESKVRIKYLESILTDLLESKRKHTKSKKEITELNKLIDTLKKF